MAGLGQITGYRVAKDDDREGWDTFVRNLARKGVYNTPFVWKDIVEKHFGCESLFIVAERYGRIVGIFPGFLKNTLPARLSRRLPFMARRFRRWIGHEPSAWDYNGPLVEGNDEETIGGLISCMERCARERGAVDAVIMPYMGNRFMEELAARILERRGWRKCGRSLSQTFDLTRSENEIWHDIAKNHRWSLNRFKDRGFGFAEESLEDSAALLYVCLDDTERRAELKRSERFALPTIPFLRDLLDHEVARIFAVRKDRIIYAMALDTYLETLVCYKWGGSMHMSKGVSIDAGSVYYNMIAHKQDGFTLYDNCWLPPSRLGPLYQFKARFGGEVRVIPRYRKMLSPKRMMLSIASVFQKLAPSVFTRPGE